MEGTYKFDWLNGGAEMVNPTVTVNKKSIVIDYETQKASADVTLTDSAGSKFGIRLENMPFDNADLNLVDIDNMVSIKLQEYKVV